MTYQSVPEGLNRLIGDADEASIRYVRSFEAYYHRDDLTAGLALQQASDDLFAALLHELPEQHSVIAFNSLRRALLHVAKVLKKPLGEDA